MGRSHVAPLQWKKSRLGAQSSSKPSPMKHGKLSRILIVEDDPDIQTVTRLALEKLGGFELDVCISGEEALLSVPKFKPDLILMDVMMPRLDGPHTVQALREIPGLETLPVIFFTAKTQTTDMAEFRKMGVLGVIPKPFDPMSLSAEIERIWTSAREKSNTSP